MRNTITIVGATGNVGREIIKILAERNFPMQNIDGVASSRSVGKKIALDDVRTITVQNIADYDFSNTSLAFFCAGSDVSKKYVKQAVQQGATVIDKASYFRMDPGVPLIIPEINSHRFQPNKSKIIASPNCVTIPLAMVLKPLHDHALLKRVVISTYQSVSGAGHAGMDELYRQTRGIIVNEKVSSTVFPKPIAFNVVPHIGTGDQSGFTDEEVKIAQEVKKIIDPKIEVVATCVRVPVFIGHSIAVTCEFKHAVSAQKAYQILRSAPGLRVVDRTTEQPYDTPIEIVGEDQVSVSRIRQDPTVPHGLCLWISCDNLRKGAALNAVQIAEHIMGTLKVTALN